MTAEQKQRLANVISDLMAETNRLRGEQRDVFLAKLTPTTTVTIRSAGEFGAAEIERLIRMLMVQKEMLTQAVEVMS